MAVDKDIFCRYANSAEENVANCRIRFKMIVWWPEIPVLCVKVNAGKNII